MKCRLLKGKENPVCTATDSAYIPSAFELEEYCRTSRYRLCSFYQLSLTKKKAPEETRERQRKFEG